MTYGALNTITTADVEHAWEAINKVSNVGLLNWERQSLTCHFLSKYSPLYAIHFRCPFTPISDPCFCHQIANFFRLNRLCCLKTNAHVRYSCYAVVCIILNVSVGVFPISELNLMIALTSALSDDVITRLILLSAVVRKYR